MKRYSILLIALIVLSCSNNKDLSDAYGNFEADEIILSSESNGVVNFSTIEEGNSFKKGDILAIVDTTQLVLKRNQLIASQGTLDSKTQNVTVQLDVLDKRKANLLREKNRFEKLLKDGAATQKQIDDLNGELDVIEKQIIATKTQLSNTNSGILSEKNPLSIQVNQLNDQIAKSYLKSPIDGTILSKYLNLNEFASIGKPVCKIANLNKMILRVYVSGTQLPNVKIGNKVKVMIDKDAKSNTTLEGTIAWISDKAEFTPKIIQTKEERVNQVYAVKIHVQNDGQIKIGMPGEIKF